MRRTDRMRRLIRLALALLITLIVVSIPLVRHLVITQEGKPMTWAQAFVFVLETITTVGYGGYSPFSSLGMNLLSAFLIVVGFTLLFFIVATLVALWVEERVAPRPPTSSSLKDHIVFTGYNELVVKFAETLDELGVPYLFIISDESEALILARRGLDVVFGKPDETDTLERANVGKAGGIVACGSDADNIGSLLAARSLGELSMVSLVERKENARYAELAGADHVILLKRAMGRGLVDWTLAIPTPADWPPPIKVEEGAEVIGDLNPSMFYITEGSQLSGMRVADIGGRTEALIVGLWRGDELVLNPEPDVEVLGAALIALGSKENVKDLARLTSDTEGLGDVVIAGYGDVGAEAHERLHSAGIEATVVDLDEKELDGQVVGDATSRDALKEASVPGAGEFVIALNDDSASIQSALEARSLNPEVHISARAVSEGSMSKFLWAGVDHPISMPTVSARMLMQSLVRLGAVDPPFDAVAARRSAGGLVGEELRAGDIRRRTGCLVVALVRGEDAVIPAHGGEFVEEGDEVVLLGSGPEIRRFEDLFT
ncbi:MAG: Calcium-gated potassium channel MthK [Methanonatronarchaeales archaeon]|nr:Calcium-gated potassium channel MthK [Methanonatronarchaeales archaeon]